MARGVREFYAAPFAGTAGKMTTSFDSIGIIGAGAWGTALACTLKRAGHDTVLWAREGDLVAVMAEKRENVTYLPGIKLDPGLRVTGDLAALALAYGVGTRPLIELDMKDGLAAV